MPLDWLAAILQMRPLRGAVNRMVRLAARAESALATGGKTG
jgi:hypothetical protein